MTSNRKTCLILSESSAASADTDAASRLTVSRRLPSPKLVPPLFKMRGLWRDFEFYFLVLPVGEPLFYFIKISVVNQLWGTLHFFFSSFFLVGGDFLGTLAFLNSFEKEGDFSS